MKYLLVVAIGVIAAVLYKLCSTQSPEIRYLQGEIFAAKLLAGSLDDEVAARLRINVTQVGPKERVEYAESMVEESRHFGTFDEFDKGCLAHLNR